MDIAIVIKVKADGKPCAKSSEVIADLKLRSLWDKLNHVIVADERNSSSEGYLLAREYQADTAPFFITVNGDNTEIYLSYYRFIKQVFEQEVSEMAEVAETMAQNPDLDFI